MPPLLAQGIGTDVKASAALLAVLFGIHARSISRSSAMRLSRHRPGQYSLTAPCDGFLGVLLNYRIGRSLYLDVYLRARFEGHVPALFVLKSVFNSDFAVKLVSTLYTDLRFFRFVRAWAFYNLLHSPV